MDRVTLMTAHAAKGLEFNNVFVVGVEADLFPSMMSQESARQIEEERRLLYVAITRAKKFCMLSYAKTRFRNGQTCICRPSRFIRDIDPATLRMATGTDIADTTYTAPKPPAFMRASTSLARPAAPASSSVPSSRSAGSCGIHAASEVTAGMKIRHERFGRGVITSIDPGSPSMGARIQVDFDNAPAKTLLLAYAKFEILDRT